MSESICVKNSLLIDLPMPIKTSRIILRPFMPGDGKMVNEAILESFEELNKWMIWADHKPSVEETEENMRKFYAEWILRQNLSMVILDAKSYKLLGCCGYNEIDWSVPKLNIGYWIRSSCTGQGFASEATNALVRYAFQQLKVIRVEVRCDEQNSASRRVIEKLGFQQEGILKNYLATHRGTRENTVIYSRLNLDNLSSLEVSW